MAVRIQVRLDATQRESFRKAARRMGLTLSAWLRRAGEESLARGPSSRLRSVADLRRFFKECDAREHGREPDWREHLEVMKEGQRFGRSEN